MTTVAVLALMGLASAAAMAASDSTTATITVTYVDLLSVPETRALTLTTTTPGATTYTQDSQTDTDGLLYSHNSTSSKKITAVATKNVSNPTNDITLTVQVEGQSAQTIVNAGTDVEGGAVVWTGIVAGGYIKNLTWTANASLATTKAGANVDRGYVWTVTFTSADAS